jgi:DNA-binding response OmpR family regulator
MVTECPLVLQAEIIARPSEGPIVTNTLSLSDQCVWVASDSLEAFGGEVLVRLSFPGLLPPISLHARIDEVREASGLGAPRAAALRFVLASESERRHVAAMCAIARDTESRAAPSAMRYRILLVEDNSLIREMFAHGLNAYFPAKNAPVSLDLADNAERAWQLLADTRTTGAPYDLVIVDYFLPASDGAALVARMRSDKALKQVPVIAISVGGADARRATLAVGADMFLDKPIVIRDLFATLARLTTHEGAAAARRPKRVLVMDDSPLILEATCEALAESGFSVDAASNLNEFEQAAAAEHDLILLDVQMPEAFGNDIAMLLRRKRGLRTKIFFLSSLGDRDLESRVAEAGVDGFISKRDGLDAVVKRVEQILREDSAPAP